MRMIPRLTAALVAGSFALSTLPAAAMGLKLGISHSSYVDSSESRTGNHVSASTEASVKADGKTQGSATAASSTTTARSALLANALSVSAQARADKQDKIKADMGLRLGWYKKSNSGSLSADAKVKLERHQTLMASMIKRAVNAVAQVSLRICKAAGGDGNTVKQCLANRKDAFKLSVSAMIDAAFNITL